MRILVLLSFVWLLAGSTQAQGVYNAAENSARRAVAKTEAASSRDPDAPQNGAPPGQSPQAMNPVLAATLKNIANLRADLTALGTNHEAGGSLTNDLAAAATGTKPATEQVEKLAADLIAAVAEKPKLRTHYQALATDLHAIFNGAHLTPLQFQAKSDEIEKFFDDAGVSFAASQAVLRDLKAVDKATQ